MTVLFYSFGGVTLIPVATPATSRPAVPVSNNDDEFGAVDGIRNSGKLKYSEKPAPVTRDLT
jgi:hypothetical protein